MEIIKNNKINRNKNKAKMDANVGLDLVKENINTLHRRTKIICTLGPASWSEDGLGKLIDGGETLLFEKEFSV